MIKLSFARILAIILAGIIVVIAVSFSINAQAPDKTFSLKNGSKLSYHITTKQATYNLHVTITSLTPDIVLNWNSDDGEKGSATVDHASFETGRQLLSDIKSMNSKVSASFLWMGKGLFDELVIGKTVYTKDNDPLRLGMVNEGLQKMNVTIDGQAKTVNVIYAKCVSSNCDDEFWILNNADNPLIIKAIISGNSIQLNQINL